jgi:hypothetical protein
MCGIYALTAIIKKKGELATDAERYALTEFNKATKSLNCECPNLLFLNFCKGILFSLRPSLLLVVIALNPA